MTLEPPDHPDPSTSVRHVKSLLEPDPGAAPTDQPFAEEVLGRLARAGRFRDEETVEHVERMSRSCALIARGLGWDAKACRDLRAATAMHDIGKVAVPGEILRKPGALAPAERALIEIHAQAGHDILAGSGDEVLDLAATVALTHHERFDGTGYPQGLQGEEIPLAGRIAAVADVFDALTHDRVHRAALDVPDALETLREGSGSQFDPAVVEAFEAVLAEVEQVHVRYPDGADEGEQDAAAFFAGTERPPRVLIVDDHEAVARGLELLLRRDGMEIAGTAGSVAAAEGLLERRAADVVVLDISLHGDDGLKLVPAAKARAQRVLLYTGSTDRATLAAARAAGADGVAAKTGSPASFVAAVRAVARGDSYIDPDLPSGEAPEHGDQPRLTPREREIVALLSQGLSGEDIAVELFLSPATVRTHIRNAMDRTGAKTRPHLVAIAASSDQISIG